MSVSPLGFVRGVRSLTSRVVMVPGMLFVDKTPGREFFKLYRFFGRANIDTRCPKVPQPEFLTDSSVSTRRGAEMEDEGEPERDDDELENVK